MEKWKMGVIAALLLGLVGYGVSQQSVENPLPFDPAAKKGLDKTGQSASENKAAGFIGQELGSVKLPAWTQLGPWENTRQPVTVASLQGQPALIEFFSIDCKHCQHAAPFMEALYKRYQPRG